MKKNSKVIKLVIVLIFILICAVITYLVHSSICIKGDISSNEKSFEPWYEEYHFIAHSGGGIDGKLYSNSLEAWELSYKNGNRLFDADLYLTSDGHIVLAHGTNNNLELGTTVMKDSKISINSFNQLEFTIPEENIVYQKFMDSKIYSKYTPMDLKMMINFIREHDDVYVLIDAKNKVKKIYQKIVEYVDHDETILEHIVPSLYRYSDYDTVMNIYKFKEVGMRQYVYNNLNYDELLKFMLENNIHVLNVDIKHMNDVDIKKIKEKGIYIYVAVVDYISDMKYYKSLGADGAITNYLYESDWKYIVE